MAKPLTVKQLGKANATMRKQMRGQWVSPMDAILAETAKNQSSDRRKKKAKKKGGK